LAGSFPNYLNPLIFNQAPGRLWKFFRLFRGEISS